MPRGKIESGYPQREIAASSYHFQRQPERGERRMVGVNAHVQDSARVPRVDDEVQRVQRRDLAEVKAGRDRAQLAAALAAVREAARGSDNLMPSNIDAAKVYASEQEICDVLRAELATYADPAEF